MEEDVQKREFIRFVNEYGTHFPIKTVMGVKLFSERRYSAKEKGSNKDDDLMRCNTLMAVKMMGIQRDPNKDQCKDQSLHFRRNSNTKLESLVVSSYGSYSSNSLNISEWSKQIQDLDKEGNLYPRALKRELGLIIRFLIKSQQISIFVELGKMMSIYTSRILP